MCKRLLVGSGNTSVCVADAAGPTPPGAAVVRTPAAVGTAVGAAGRVATASNPTVGTGRGATGDNAVGDAARREAGMGSRSQGVGYLARSRLGSCVDGGGGCHGDSHCGN
jgi:hypothetical protein